MFVIVSCHLQLIYESLDKDFQPLNYMEEYFLLPYIKTSEVEIGSAKLTKVCIATIIKINGSLMYIPTHETRMHGHLEPL